MIQMRARVAGARVFDPELRAMVALLFAKIQDGSDKG
jgi:hypothetical protein